MDTVKVVKKENGFNVVITPKALGGSITIYGVGTTIDLPAYTEIKISSENFKLEQFEHEPFRNLTYELVWDFGHCHIVETDFFELRQYFECVER